MNLSQLIMQLDDLDDHFIIYAEQNPVWHSTSEAILISCEQNPKLEGNGKKYLLEVNVAKEVIEVWKKWHCREPSIEEKISAIIYYAQNDAYIPDN